MALKGSALEGRISNGPSKFDLMCSLFDGKDVTFTFEHIGERPVRVQMVQLESGRHQDWCIAGYVIHVVAGTWQHFKGYYNTKQRSGTFKLK